MNTACQEPRLGAACLEKLIQAHGFPTAYPRVFWKLSEHVEELHQYVAEFVRKPGRHIGNAVDLINRAIQLRQLDPVQLNGLAPLVEAKTKEMIDAAIAAQDSVERRWRRDESYFYLRIDLGAYLDLAGIIPSCDTSGVRLALQLDDPLINLYLLTALINKGEEIPEKVIDRAAGSYETLASLYALLEAKDRLDLFPEAYWTFEHFAACEMVEWLLYPSELGEEPTQINLKKVIVGEDEEGNSQRWCLWRFTDATNEAFAGVSGPYDQNAFDHPTPTTVASSEVFSNFEPWDGLTPEQHLEGVSATLRNWRVVDCST